MFARLVFNSALAIALLCQAMFTSAQDQVTQKVIVQNELGITVQNIRVRLSREYDPSSPFAFDVARSVNPLNQVEFETVQHGRRYVWAQLEYRAEGERTVRTGAFVVRPARGQSGRRYIQQVIFRIRSADGTVNQAQVDEGVVLDHGNSPNSQHNDTAVDDRIVAGESETGSFDAALANALEQLPNRGDRRHFYEVLETSGVYGGITGGNSLRIKIRAHLEGSNEGGLGEGEDAHNTGRADYQQRRPGNIDGSMRENGRPTTERGRPAEPHSAPYAERGPYIKLMNRTSDLRSVTIVVSSSRQTRHYDVTRDRAITLSGLPTKGFGVVAFDRDELRIGAAAFNLRVPFEVEITGEDGDYRLHVNPLE
jgi:hypothetical protein